jgi:hypothetical protein
MNRLIITLLALASCAQVSEPACEGGEDLHGDSIYGATTTWLGSTQCGTLQLGVDHDFFRLGNDPIPEVLNWHVTCSQEPVTFTNWEVRADGSKYFFGTQTIWPGESRTITLGVLPNVMEVGIDAWSTYGDAGGEYTVRAY